jgi:hypothetical protein
MNRLKIDGLSSNLACSSKSEELETQILVHEALFEKKKIKGELKEVKKDLALLKHKYKLALVFGPFSFLIFFLSRMKLYFSIRHKKILPNNNDDYHVLHIVPKSYKLKDLQYHGSTKDILNRSEFFEDNDINVTRLHVKKRDLEMLNRIRLKGLNKYNIIVFDIPGCFPNTLKYLFLQSKHSKIIFRSHNAEFLHRYDYAKAEMSLSRKIKTYKRALGSLIRDFETALFSDEIITIADSDTRYWNMLRFLSIRKKVLCVPYFLPRSLHNSSEPSFTKKNICVAMGSAAPGPLIKDAFKNYSNLIKKLNGECSEWEFFTTGQIDSSLQMDQRIKNYGLLDNPMLALQTARIMIILSDLGRGFKTKILDAITYNCYVALSPKLYRRMPDELKPYCICVRPTSITDLTIALKKSLEPFPKGEINSQIKERAFQTMKIAMGG